MKVYGQDKLVACWDRHADARKPLVAWLNEARASVWHSPAEIRRRFASASFLAGGRVVFNIKGNRYRLVVIVVYQREAMIVRFAGTHAEYDDIDAEVI